jgi:predicted HTH transcriptional regulator
MGYNTLDTMEKRYEASSFKKEDLELDQYHFIVVDYYPTNTRLFLVSNGCTKEEIIEETHLSHNQLRRIIAEIVDKGFLRYIEHQQVYITTDKGYIFLDSKGSNQKT